MNFEFRKELAMRKEQFDDVDGQLRISNPQSTIYAFYELNNKGTVVLTRSEGLSEGTKIRWKKLAEESFSQRKLRK